MKNTLLRGHFIKLLFVLIIFSQAMLFAQPAIEWDKTIGNSVASYLYSSQQTADGGYILGGTSYGTGFDQTDPGVGGGDYWIVKLSADGTKEWDHAYGGTGRDDLNSVRQTADGGYILGGSSDSDAGGDKSENNRSGYGVDGYRQNDYWIVKISADGTKEWDKTLGGKRSDGLQSVIQTADGGYIIGGVSTSGSGQDKTDPVIASIDYWVVKLTASGAKQWDKTYGSLNTEQNCQIRQTPDGGYIIGGSTLAEYMITRISPDGTLLWEKRFGGSGSDILTTIETTKEGGYIVGGYSDTNADGDKSAGSQVGPLSSSRMRDYWILKLTSSGTKEWERTIGGLIFNAGGYYSGESFLRSINQTSDGGYILGGYSNAQKGRSKSENNKGKSDYWIVKIDAKGGKEWDKTIGSNEDDELQSVSQTADGGYFLAGSSSSDIKFDKSENKKGQNDFWVVKLGSKDPTPNAISIRINAGGAAFTASGARTFDADRYYQGIDRTSSVATGDILNTNDDELYRSGRCSPSFSYNIPVPDSKVNVILHFAEIWYGVPGKGAGGAGKRQFNVNIEGSRKLTNFDIFATADGAMRAVQKSIPVTVTDGMLNIDFTSGAADMPRIAAIEVEVISRFEELSIGPVADAYVRFGNSSQTNYGLEQTIDLKATTKAELERTAYIKFSLASLSEITSAKLRIYGRNYEGTNLVRVGLTGIDNDSWSETGITGSNAPTGPSTFLGSFDINDQNHRLRFFEVDITEFAKVQLAQDKMLTLMLADPSKANKRVTFNSRENAVNPPELIVVTAGPVTSAARIARTEILIEAGNKAENELTASTIFPNPVQKHFTVQIGNQHQDNISLQLINAAGRSYPVKTKEELHAGSKAEADISGLSLSKGVYLLKVQSGNTSEVLKVLVTE